MDILKKTSGLLWAAALCLAATAWAGIPEVSFERLSDRDISPQGKAALRLPGLEWQHAESAHFVYHFTDEKQAETVYLHAEVHYQWIKELFGVEKDAWSKKSHLFIFDKEDDWKKFNTRSGEGYSGFSAFTDGWELYIHRAPYWLSPQRTLAHEMTHIILFRFLDGPIPLFLNEGFAEFMAFKAVAVKAGGNEYNIRTLQLVGPDQYIPLRELIASRSYPKEPEIFYRQSELLVRHLILTYGSKKFYELLKKVSQGDDFGRVVRDLYGLSLEDLEAKFKAYAVTPSGKKS